MRRTEPTEDLSAWLDGELAEDVAADLEAELQRDPELRAELEGLEAVVRLVRDAGPAQAPIGFAHRLMARIDQEEAKAKNSAWSWLRRPWGIPLEGWALGFAAMVALVLLFPFRAQQDDPDEPARQVSPAALELPAPRPPSPEIIPGTASVADPVPSAPLAKATLPPKPVAPVQPEAGTPSEGTDVAGAPEVTPAPRAVEKMLPIAPVRVTVKSTDPKTKREILGLVAQYGAASNPDGGPVTTAAMLSTNETLTVSLPQADLARFTTDLKRLGYDVTTQQSGELLGGGSVTLRVDIQVEPGTSEPDAAAPAQVDEGR